MSNLLRFRVGLTAVLLMLAVACSSQPRTLVSNDPPGNPIVTFVASTDKTWTTALLSNPFETTAGVSGQVLAVTAFKDQKAYANELALDLNGDLGINGTFLSRSSRQQKKDITTYKRDALALLQRASLVSYRYRNESESTPLHIGFIAEDLPPEFTGPLRTSFNINSSLAITMAATKELDARIGALQRQVERLQSEVRTLKRKD